MRNQLLLANLAHVGTYNISYNLAIFSFFFAFHFFPLFNNHSKSESACKRKRNIPTRTPFSASMAWSIFNWMRLLVQGKSSGSLYRLTQFKCEITSSQRLTTSVDQMSYWFAFPFRNWKQKVLIGTTRERLLHYHYWWTFSLSNSTDRLSFTGIPWILRKLPW